MRLTLEILAPEPLGCPARASFAPGPLVSLGRAPGCSLVLPHEDVSRQHALLRHGNPPPGRRGRRAWWLQDLESTRGTRVCGRDVGQGWELRAGDVIELGPVRLRVELDAGAPEPGPCARCHGLVHPGAGLRQGRHRLCPACVQAGSEGPSIGRYWPVAELGAGSYGKVWLASDGERLVALKTTAADPQYDELDHEEAERRFAREARVLAALQHPHLIRVYEAGLYAGGSWLAMELLHVDLHRLVQDEGPLPAARALELARELGEGLRFVHEQGILHRDLKPGNALLDAAGQPRLSDFGLCRGTHDTRLTRPGMGLGTIYYSPPEQLLDARAADARSDIYGVGAILYYLLSGTHPFGYLQGSFAEVARAVKLLPLTPPHELVPSVPREVSQVVLRCMRKDPAERFASCAELLEALGSLSG